MEYACICSSKNAPSKPSNKVQGSMQRKGGDSDEDSEEDSDANAAGRNGHSDESEGSYDDGDLSVNSDAVRKGAGRGGAGAKKQITSDDDEFLDDEDGMDGEEDESEGSDEHF